MINIGYKKYTYDQYTKALKLLEKGLKMTTISKMLDIPKSTLHYWIHKKHKPPTTRWIPKPTKELAYVLGVLIGNGYIRINKSSYKYYVGLCAKDHAFVAEFNKALAQILNRTPKNLRKRHRKWEIEYSSKAFYTWYKNQNLETLKQYVEHDQNTIIYFLRGLYDSNGNNYKYKEITLISNDQKILHYVHYLLKKYFNIIATRPYITKTIKTSTKKAKNNPKKRRNKYNITIYKKQHIEKFLNEIGFTIPEKQLGL